MLPAGAVPADPVDRARFPDLRTSVLPVCIVISPELAVADAGVASEIPPLASGDNPPEITTAPPTPVVPSPPLNEVLPPTLPCPPLTTDEPPTPSGVVPACKCVVPWRVKESVDADAVLDARMVTSPAIPCSDAPLSTTTAPARVDCGEEIRISPDVASPPPATMSTAPP